MNPHLRALFFDAGGTLIHLDPGCILGALAQLGRVRDEAAFLRADLAARRAVVNWLASGEPGGEQARWQVFARALLAALECDPEAERAVQAAVAARHAAARLWTRTVDGTAGTLARLRARGYILGVVSNADGRVDSYLANAGLLDHFDFVIDSGRVGCEKPDPRIFRLACERAGVAPAGAVHVGDVYEVDVLGARAAGITPVLLDPDDLLPAADCVRIHALSELPGWLDREGAA